MRGAAYRCAGRALLAFSMMFCLLSSASAHHNSGALFDLDREVSIEGTLTRFDWRNPHLYLYVETVAADGGTVNWRIEGGPVALMRRIGWTSETLQPGDRVKVTVNPSRNENKTSGLLLSLGVAGRDLPPIRGEEALKILSGSDDAPKRRARSLAGTWVTLLDEKVDVFDDPTKLDLTEAGTAAVAAFDESTMHPGLNCIPYTAPLLMLVPDTKSIEVRDDIVRIRGEFDGAERTIYLDGRKPAEPSVQGHSVGHWEDGALVVETDSFADHRMGNAFSLPSGSGKRLSERLELSDDGATLTYGFVLSDPEYLAQPVAAKVTWAYRPDIEFAPSRCDLENARRYLDD